MKRSTPLRRTAWRRAPQRPQGNAETIEAAVMASELMRELAIRPSTLHRGTYEQNRVFAPQPKEAPIQHEGYMAAVRTLRCWRCRRNPPSQFCHADEGKGEKLKTDCRLGWPGCAECHYLVGSTGKLGKIGRRVLETVAAADTRAEIRRRGLWPADLPPWPSDPLPADSATT